MKIFLSILFIIACLAPVETNNSYPPETRYVEQYRVLYEIGIASWYGSFHQGMEMANGKPFDMNRLSAAHKTLPLGTKIRVTNYENNRSIDLIVTDRGPYVKERVVDLSYAAAQQLQMVGAGIVACKVEVIRT